MLYENLEIDPNGLPDVFETAFNSHPERYLRFRMISLIMVFLVLSIGVGVIWTSENYSIAIIASSVWAFVLVLFFIFEVKAFPRRGYMVRELDISYRSGLIFRDVVTIPYNRIQHSEVSHGPIERLMKLSTLKIFTAGGSSSDLSIRGLEPTEAEKIKEWLTNKAAQYV